MTAHDPRVTLTGAEKLAMQRALNGPRSGSVAGMLLTRAVEQIVADRLDEQVPEGWYVVTPHHYRSLNDRLDRVRAVAEQWDNGCAREVLAALDAPQDAPRGSVGGEQGAEVAGGRSEGERPGEGDPWEVYLDRLEATNPSPAVQGAIDVLRAEGGPR